MQKSASRIFLFLGLFAVFLVAGLPHGAWANPTNTPAATDDCSPTSPIVQGFIKSQTIRAQIQTQQAYIVFTNVPAIDLAATYCIKRFLDFFDTIDSLGSGSIAHMLAGVIEGQIVQLLNGACNAGLSVLNQLKTFALSQLNRLCLPLPMGGFDLNPNLGLVGPPCNGTQLLNVQETQPSPGNPTMWQFWNYQAPL